MGKKLVIIGADFSQNAIVSEAIELVTAENTTEGKYFNQNGAMQNAANWYAAKIDVTQYRGQVLEIKPLFKMSTTVNGWFDTDNTYHGMYSTSPYDWDDAGGADKMTWTVPDNAVYLCIACSNAYSCWPISAIYHT